MQKEGMKMRICEKCGENPADIHIRQIINDKETGLYICSKCAETMKKKFLSFLKVNNFITSMMQQVETNDENKVCSFCKFDINKIRKLGRVGCAMCYETFEKELEPIVAKMNINRSRININEKAQSEVEKLQTQLNKAVLEEEYEKAAELRDKITLLKGEKHDNLAKKRS